MILDILTILFTVFFHKEENATYDYTDYLDSQPLHTYEISDNNLLLSYDGYAWIYNTDTRVKNVLEECESCVYGYDREIVRCEYEHRSIQSADQYSTSISLYDSNNILLSSIDIFPTVIPFVCNKNYALLKTAYPFLEQNIYISYWKDGSISEIY